MEIVKRENPQDLISQAIEKGADLEKLEKLLELKLRWEANEAKKAYVEAVSEFKKIPIRITKDKQNTQYKSMYTTLGNLVNTVNPELSKHGLSASWDIAQNGKIQVTCKLTHSMGHSESATASAPVDTSGAKNPIQQIKSTITYLKSVTFESITGLASTEANLDDDGNGATDDFITKEQEKEIDALVRETNADAARFLAFMKVELYSEIKQSQFKKAKEALLAKKRGAK